MAGIISLAMDQIGGKDTDTPRTEGLCRPPHEKEEQVTHKAGGVVVPHGLGVAEGLQQGVGADDLIFQGPLKRSE